MILHPIAHNSLRIPARASFFLLLSIICVAITPTARAAATFTPLGTFGGFSSQAFDVSADGSVVVGLVGDGSGLQPAMFRWTAAGSTIVPGNFNYFNDVPLAVSGDGSTVVGQYNSPSGPEAFRWTLAGGIEGLGDFPGGVFNSGAIDVSYDGSVAVGFGSQPNPQGGEAFRWSQATGIVALGPNAQFGAGVSDNGAIVVGPSNDGSFRWTSDTGAVELNIVRSARRISADGSVIVGTRQLPPPSGSIRPQKEAFRWTESEGLIGLRSLSLPFRIESTRTQCVRGRCGHRRYRRYPCSASPRKAFYWHNGIGDFQQILLLIRSQPILTAGTFLTRTASRPMA